MSTVNLQEVLIVNGIGIILMIFLLCMRSDRIKKRTVRDTIYDAMIWFTIAGSAAETLTIFIDGKVFPGCIPLNYFLNTFCFMSTCCNAALWCMYVDLRIFNSMHRLRKRAVFLMIPFLADFALCMINLSGNGIVFKISEENVYKRGPFATVMFGILMFYLIYSICLADRSKTSGLYLQRFPTYYYVIPAMAGAIIQALMYGITLGWTATAIALLFVQIQVQSMDSLIDSLSGLYNRRYLDNVLEHLKRHHKRPVYGVMMDVNSFKQINDNYGHSEGDNAIRAIGQILSDAVPDCGIAIRYAGDEFILLLSTKSESIVKDTIDCVNDNIEKYNSLKKPEFKLSISMGYGRFDDKSGDTEAFIREIDRKMYEAKEKYYMER